MQISAAKSRNIRILIVLIGLAIGLLLTKSAHAWVCLSLHPPEIESLDAGMSDLMDKWIDAISDPPNELEYDVEINVNSTTNYFQISDNMI